MRISEAIVLFLLVTSIAGCTVLNNSDTANLFVWHLLWGIL